MSDVVKKQCIRPGCAVTFTVAPDGPDYCGTCGPPPTDDDFREPVEAHEPVRESENEVNQLTTVLTVIGCVLLFVAGLTAGVLIAHRFVVDIIDYAWNRESEEADGDPDYEWPEIKAEAKEQA